MTTRTSEYIFKKYKDALKQMLTQCAERCEEQLPLGQLFVEGYKIRSTGWVSQNWSMAQELSPIINKVGGRVVEPIITNMISNYPDAELPRIAHDVVDAAIENGGMNLFEGNLSFDAEDLRQLKKLLDYNLPVSEASGYEVKTQP